MEWFRKDFDKDKLVEFLNKHHLPSERIKISYWSAYTIALFYLSEKELFTTEEEWLEREKNNPIKDKKP